MSRRERAVLVVGGTRSGKTTWAAEQEAAAHVSRETDALRATIREAHETIKDLRGAMAEARRDVAAIRTQLGDLFQLQAGMILERELARFQEEVMDNLMAIRTKLAGDVGNWEADVANQVELFAQRIHQMTAALDVAESLRGATNDEGAPLVAIRVRPA